MTAARKRFLWAHKEVDFASHPVVGLVLQVRDVEKLPQALSLKNLDPFLGVSNIIIIAAHTKNMWIFCLHNL